MTTDKIKEFLLEQRIIKINGIIDEKLSEDVINHLYYYDSLNQNTIYLHVNSFGGSLRDGLAIYDITQRIKSKVCTINVGSAMSMACFLLSCCGSEGMRHATPNSIIMWHPSSTYMGWSSTEEIAITGKEVERLDNLVDSILAKHTKKDLSFIKTIGEKTTYITPTEAIEYGLIDGLYVKENKIENESENQLNKIKNILLGTKNDK
jgi:ATP-dependent Clp protease protease subunit